MIKLAALIVVGGIGSFAQGSLLEIAGQRVGRTLRKRLFGVILSQPAEFFDVNQSAELSNRLSHDVHEVAEHLVENVAVGIQAVITAVISIVYLFRIAPRLGFLTPLILPLLSLGAVCYGNVVKKLSETLLNQLAAATQLATERFLQIRTVKAFHREEEENQKYCVAIDHSYKLATTVALAEGSYLAATYAAANGGLFAVFLVGARLVLKGVLTVGQLSSFLMYTDKLGTSYNSLAEATSGILKAQGAGARLFALLEAPVPAPAPAPASANSSPSSSFLTVTTPTTPSVSSGTSSLSPANHPTPLAVVFDHVSFHYPSRPEARVLTNVSFRIDPGEVVGLTGPSGSGKSTITLLLQGLYQPQSGSVTIGGLDPRDCQDIGWVGQEPMLFGGTIRENILYGCTGKVTDGDLLAATRVAQAHEFIKALPHGYETILKEGGLSLSGGQRQRIALARALVKRPAILVFDEISSALDGHNETAVAEAVQGYLQSAPRPSCLIISHRQPLLQLADVVYTLNDGVLSNRPGSAISL